MASQDSHLVVSTFFFLRVKLKRKKRKARKRKVGNGERRRQGERDGLVGEKHRWVNPQPELDPEIQQRERAEF